MAPNGVGEHAPQRCACGVDVTPWGSRIRSRRQQTLSSLAEKTARDSLRTLVAALREFRLVRGRDARRLTPFGTSLEAGLF